MLFGKAEPTWVQYFAEEDWISATGHKPEEMVAGWPKSRNNDVMPWAPAKIAA
jgi:hypothetical protein